MSTETPNVPDVVGSNVTGQIREDCQQINGTNKRKSEEDYAELDNNIIKFYEAQKMCDKYQGLVTQERRKMKVLEPSLIASIKLHGERTVLHEDGKIRASRKAEKCGILAMDFREELKKSEFTEEQIAEIVRIKNLSRLTERLGVHKEFE